MKGLSTTNNSRRSPSCSFCRDPQHQISECPHVDHVWLNLRHGTIPMDYIINHLPSYYANGAYWGELYKITKSSYAKWKRAQERAKTKRTRSKVQTCGYCKETGHTRSKCEHLDFHKRMLVKANRNFRKWFYQEYVERQGLSTGAIISFDFVTPQKWDIPSTRTKIKTITTEINWDSINLLSTLDIENVPIGWRTEVDGAQQKKLKSIRDFMTSRVLCKVPSSSFNNDCKASMNVRAYYAEDTKAFYAVPLKMIPSSRQVVRSFDNHNVIGYNGGECAIENFQVVRRAPQVLSDDWIDGFSDEMSVIFKKFSQKQLEFFGVIEHIKDWATKDV